jgi:23S rRNA pseudouridine2605 synthase
MFWIMRLIDCNLLRLLPEMTFFIPISGRIFSSRKSLLNLYSKAMKFLTYLQQTHGLARRVITDLIQNREILLNGMIVDNFLVEVQPGDAYIITSLWIAGTVEKPDTSNSHLVLFYKPVGYTVSKSDPHNDTIYDILPSWRKQKYYPIGRLDKDSCWLLLLTDNAARVNQLSHPRYEHQKLYHVLLKQPRNPQHNDVVLQGIVIYDEQSKEDVLLACDQVETIAGGVAITLHEGKNRHIRKMLWQLWYDIKELKRISCCGIMISDLVVGEYRIYEVSSLDGFLERQKSSHSLTKKSKNGLTRDTKSVIR